MLGTGKKAGDVWVVLRKACLLCYICEEVETACTCMQVSKEAAKIGGALNAARAKRGLKARAVRACVVGFPNVGKSALINRLLGRRLAESAAKPGITRSLRWMRIGGQLDLLDAPGGHACACCPHHDGCSCSDGKLYSESCTQCTTCMFAHERHSQWSLSSCFNA